MKIYQQGGNNKPKKNSNAIVWYVILLVVTVAVIVTSIALSSIGKDATVDPGPSGNEVTDPVTTKPVTYTLPFEQYTVAREASLDSLVYMPAINMWKTHNGVDFLPGDDPGVRVMADGTVLSVTETTLEGWVVVVDHGDGLISSYKSLASASVAEGATVTSGEVIGTAGTMMTETDIGNHVHVEVTKNGTLVDPLDYLNTDSSK